MIPTWAYAKDQTGLYINMFVGSRVHVGRHSPATGVEVIQKTEYPWNGLPISITVNPKETKTFSVYVRIPDRTTSKLYTEIPAVHGVKRFAINGVEKVPVIQKGYAVVTREWKAGDRIELELPMEPQRRAGSPHSSGSRHRVALKYGPLVYRRRDGRTIRRSIRSLSKRSVENGVAPRPSRGVMVISGKWADGSALLAIPNYARMNRVGAPHEYPRDEEVTVVATPEAGTGPVSARRGDPAIESKIWI